MNVRNLFRTAMVAAPMAIMPMKGAAQSAAHVAENAQKIVVADTIKAAKTTVQDARTVVLKKWDGHFDGNVVDGKIGNGKLNYNEKAKTVLAETAPAKTTYDISGQFVHANGMPGNSAYRLDGVTRRGNNEYSVQALYGSGNGKSNFGGGIGYTRDFPLLDNHNGSKLEAYGKLSAVADIRRDRVTKPVDHLGIAHTTLVGGIKGNAKVGDFNLGADAYIGGGESIRIKANSDKKDTYSHFAWGAKIKAGFKNVYAFVTGGKAPETNGGFVGAGAGVKF